MTSRIFTAGAAPTPTVNVIGVPAAIAVVGPVMLTPVRALRLTVTVAVLPATFAVTIVVRVAVRLVLATPLESVVADPAPSCPWSAVKLTGTPGSPAPVTSSTRAAISVVPPDGGSTPGVAVSSTRSAAAVPTRRFSSLPDAPPENAVMVAVPLWPLEMKRTRTWPFRVRASAGSIRPSVVVKVMTVPFCTGVPAPDDDVEVGAVGVVGVPGAGVVGVVGVVAVVPFSMAVATISMSPLSGTVFDVAKIEMTVPPGARSGTLSHAEVNIIMHATRTGAKPARTMEDDGLDCASIENTKDSSFMGLRGQYTERGYAMAALLIALAIMAILLTVAMPVWRHQARRENEAELVFRGEQYARAVALFRYKNANIPNAFPPSIDSLVQGRFLRRKYKDPMTKDGEFELIGVGSAQPGTNVGSQQPGFNTGSPAVPTARGNTSPQPTGQVAGGMMGVRSKSTGNLDPRLPGRDAIRPMGIYVQHRAAARRGDADGQHGRRRSRR